MKSLKRPFWSNGMIQHGFLQAKLFSDLGYKVYMITPELDSDKSFDFVEQIEEGWLMRNLYWIPSDIKNWKELEIDLYILWEVNLPTHIIRDIKERFECPVVGMQCGNTLFVQMLHYVEGKEYNQILKEQNIDTLWCLPHHYQWIDLFTSKHPTIPTRKVPYIWEPWTMLRETPKPIHSLQQTSTLRIAICEPDENIAKHSFPLLMSLNFIAQQNPSITFVVQKYCSFQKKWKAKELQMITDQKRIQVKQHTRTPFPTIAADNDIVLSYQYNCELNNLYFDAVASHTIVIHNSPMVKEIGWYYNDLNISAIGTILRTIRQYNESQLQEKFKQDKDYIHKEYSTSSDQIRTFFRQEVNRLT